MSDTRTLPAPTTQPPVTPPTTEADDATFLAAVEATTWPGEAFNHRAHVRLAWLCLRDESFEPGLERLRTLIRRYATALGAPGKYHETLTRAWAWYVKDALRAAPEARTFDAFLQASPDLQGSRLLERHYRKETLDSEAAKAGWVPPDKEPLPDGASLTAPGRRAPS